MDPKIVCPYDQSHNITNTNFSKHLLKCKRQYKGPPKVECPYNILHILDKNELEAHILICENNVYKQQEENMDLHMPKPPDFQPLETTECWDEEPVSISYHPQAYCLAEPVVRRVQGLTSFEKREFRRKERERLTNLKTSAKDQEKSS